jgi:hypothetical protein
VERGVTLNIEARISKLEDRRPNTEYGIEELGARKDTIIAVSPVAVLHSSIPDPLDGGHAEIEEGTGDYADSTDFEQPPITNVNDLQKICVIGEISGFRNE